MRFSELSPKSKRRLSMRPPRQDGLEENDSGSRVEQQAVSNNMPPSPVLSREANTSGDTAATSENDIESNHIEPVPEKTTQSSIKFADSTIRIAIDVSTSTRGNILRQEIQAISTLCYHLSPSAIEKLLVLPWSDSAHDIIGVSNIASLKNSYGTSPSVLTKNQSHASAIRQASLWFLLTDGKIERDEIQKFATGLADRGLHGIACVVIMFGQGHTNLSKLNVSVGLALFSVAPHCLFTYYDAGTMKTYVLQYKGCFSGILPPNMANPDLCPETDLRSLLGLGLDDLTRLQIPQPTNLSSDELELPDGMVIDMEDVYHDRLDRKKVSQIFGNDDSLKSVLMTAATRGHSAQILSWLEKQKRDQLDSHAAARPDLEERALCLVRELIDCFDGKATQLSKDSLQDRLRHAHRCNWRAFLSDLDSQVQGNFEFNIKVRDSTERINSVTHGPSRDLYKPSSISPVSPYSRNQHSTSQRNSNQYSGTPGPAFGHYFQQASMHQPKSIPNSVSSHFAPEQTLCYMPGYHKDPRPTQVGGICELCGDTSYPVALLLKEAECEARTVGFPLPNDRAKQVYPLAMGNFPETDIISNFVCCDPCSYFLQKIGRAPYGQKITGALLITNWAKNVDLLTSTIGASLEHRFSETDLLHVFLAIIYTSIHQDPETFASDETSPALKDALQWLSREIERSIHLPTNSLQSNESRILDNSNFAFHNELVSLFEDACQRKGQLLDYPLDGFAVLVYAAQNNSVDASLIRRAIYLKLLECLREHTSSIDDGATREPNSFITDSPSSSRQHLDFLSNTGEISETTNDSESTGVLSSFASLADESLVGEDVWATFESMGDPFNGIKKSWDACKARPIQALVETQSSLGDSTECLNSMWEMGQIQEALASL